MQAPHPAGPPSPSLHRVSPAVALAICVAVGKRISPLRLCSLVCKRVTQSLLQKARAKRLASDTGLAFVGAEEVSLPHLSRRP